MNYTDAELEEIYQRYEAKFDLENSSVSQITEKLKQYKEDAKWVRNFIGMRINDYDLVIQVLTNEIGFKQAEEGLERIV